MYKSEIGSCFLTMLCQFRHLIESDPKGQINVQKKFFIFLEQGDLSLTKQDRYRISNTKNCLPIDSFVNC